MPLEEAAAQSEADALVQRVLGEAGVTEPPPDVAQVMRQAILLLDHAVRSGFQTLGHAFQPLLGAFDDYALRLLEQQLKPSVPSDKATSIAFFDPDLSHLPERDRLLLEKNQRYLRDMLVFGRAIQRLGTLLFCLSYAQQDKPTSGGVWSVVRQRFATSAFAKLYADLQRVNDFRNTHVAHVETPLTNAEEAWKALRVWLRCLGRMVTLCAA